MSLLVIDTALGALSVALLAEDGAVIAAHSRELARGHAEALMPAVAEVMGDRRPDAVLVDTGPGSFTGLRIGIAAARALALAWDVPISGYRSLALIAAPLFAADPALLRLQVVAEAGRGQLYVSLLDPSLVTDAEPLALDPVAAAAHLDPSMPVAGPGASRIPGRFTILAKAWPDARHALLLPLAARSLGPEPQYVRPPDAVAA